MIGHLLGAAGAVENIVTVKAISEQTAPPTANYRELDPECDLDYVRTSIATSKSAPQCPTTSPSAVQTRAWSGTARQASGRRRRHCRHSTASSSPASPAHPRRDRAERRAEGCVRGELPTCKRGRRLARAGSVRSGGIPHIEGAPARRRARRPLGRRRSEGARRRRPRGRRREPRARRRDHRHRSRPDGEHGGILEPRLRRRPERSKSRRLPKYGLQRGRRPGRDADRGRRGGLDGDGRPRGRRAVDLLQLRPCRPRRGGCGGLARDGHADTHRDRGVPSSRPPER